MRLSQAPRISVLGVGFDPVTLDGAAELIIDHIKTGAGFASVFTPNADIVEGCRSDKTGEQTALFASAALSLADGIGVVRASKRLGTPLPEQVAGIELGEALLSRAADEGIPVFFLGGRDGVADDAAERMRERNSPLIISGTHHGYFDKNGDENGDVLHMICESGARLLFVCLGAPAQEKWIIEASEALDAAGVKCALGLGGSLDVWSGRVRRAPHILRSLGLEWLWRSLSPSRFSRIGTVFRFICDVEKEKKGQKFPHRT